MWPFSTRVKWSVISVGWRCRRRHGAGDVGGAVEILRAGIEQIELARAQRAGWSPGRRGNARWRRSGPAPEMVGKRQAPEALVLARACLRAVGRLHLARARPSAARADSQARKRVSAAPSRTWAARIPSSSTGFLQAFGSWHGSLPSTDRRRRPRRAGRRPMPARCAGSAARCASGGRARRGAGRAPRRLDRDLVAEMALGLGARPCAGR